MIGLVCDTCLCLVLFIVIWLISCLLWFGWLVGYNCYLCGSCCRLDSCVVSLVVGWFCGCGFMLVVCMGVAMCGFV